MAVSDDEVTYDDGDSPETTDGQIRPEGVRAGEPVDGQGPEPSGTQGGPADADSGGRAHTPPDEGHPDLSDDGEGRDSRTVGGPKLADDEREAEGSTTTGGAKGDIQTKGMEPHE